MSNSTMDAPSILLSRVMYGRIRSAVRLAGLVADLGLVRIRVSIP